MDRRSLLFVLGFALAGSGLYALILSLVGVKVSYLVWIDGAGPLLGFLGRLALVMSGALAIVMGATDWTRERRLIEEYRAERAQRLRARDN